MNNSDLVLPPLYPYSRIHSRIGELALEIDTFYRTSPVPEGMHPSDSTILTLILMRGAMYFASELTLWIPQQLELLPFNVSSYHGEKYSSGTIHYDSLVLYKCKNRRVLLIDDIHDTGSTLSAIQNDLKGRAAEVKTVVLLEKDVPRKAEAQVDWVGFKIPDLFVVGFGLDFQEKYRNLRYITSLE